MKMKFVRKMTTFNFSDFWSVISCIMNGLFFIDFYNVIAMGDG